MKWPAGLWSDDCSREQTTAFTVATNPNPDIRGKHLHKQYILLNNNCMIDFLDCV